MISNDVSSTETVRTVFIIDDKQIVRTILIYPLNVGRFIPEILRTVQALQMADCSKGSTAANWMPGQPVIIPAPKTFEELQERQKYIKIYLYYTNYRQFCQCIICKIIYHFFSLRLFCAYILRASY